MICISHVIMMRTQIYFVLDLFFHSNGDLDLCVLQVRGLHDDGNSVTSGETTTSDSGRGGSEDDSTLPPIAEVPPECGSG